MLSTLLNELHGTFEGPCAVVFRRQSTQMYQSSTEPIREGSGETLRTRLDLRLGVGSGESQL